MSFFVPFDRNRVGGGVRGEKGEEAVVLPLSSEDLVRKTCWVFKGFEGIFFITNSIDGCRG